MTAYVQCCKIAFYDLRFGCFRTASFVINEKASAPSVCRCLTLSEFCKIPLGMSRVELYDFRMPHLISFLTLREEKRSDKLLA